MSQVDHLGLLAEMTENARETTQSYPDGFFSFFVSYGTDVNRVSRHIDNGGLRKIYFHLGTLQTPYEEALNYELQNALIEELEVMQFDAVGGTEELVYDAATSVTIRSISDLDGRETIDMRQLKSDLEAHRSDLGEDAEALITFNLAKAMRNIQRQFVEKHSQEIIDFYLSIEDTYKKN